MALSKIKENQSLYFADKFSNNNSVHGEKQRELDRVKKIEDNEFYRNLYGLA